MLIFSNNFSDYISGYNCFKNFFMSDIKNIFLHYRSSNYYFTCLLCDYHTKLISHIE
jgi:hypothetical protein